jgi:hypothetical protein
MYVMLQPSAFHVLKAITLNHYGDISSFSWIITAAVKYLIVTMID